MNLCVVLHKYTLVSTLMEGNFSKFLSKTLSFFFFLVALTTKLRDMSKFKSTTVKKALASFEMQNNFLPLFLLELSLLRSMFFAFFCKCSYWDSLQKAVFPRNTNRRWANSLHSFKSKRNCPPFFVCNWRNFHVHIWQRFEHWHEIITLLKTQDNDHCWNRFLFLKFLLVTLFFVNIFCFQLLAGEKGSAGKEGVGCLPQPCLTVITRVRDIDLDFMIWRHEASGWV